VGLFLSENRNSFLETQDANPTAMLK